MKFAKYLEQNILPKWSQHYIDYKRLKKILGTLAKPSDGGGGASSSASSEGEAGGAVDPAAERWRKQAHEVSRRFLAELQKDVAKVNAFVVRERDRLRSEQLVLDAAGPSGASDREEHERRLWRAAAELREFVELNYTGFYKAAKKHDKVTKLRYKGAMMHAVELQPFMVLLEPSRHSDGAGNSRSGDIFTFDRQQRQQQPLQQHLTPEGSESEGSVVQSTALQQGTL